MTDITELAQSMKAAAKKATPGPWALARDRKTVVSNQSHPIANLSDAMHRMLADGTTGQDAEFISLANPANILSLVEALEKAQSANECLREQSAEWERKAISNFEDCAEMSARIEELESQRKLAFTASIRWADKFREAEKRIAELESRTVKPPVHPTVASENLDDETLQELIEFRRTTFEYHSKEGNKVQTIIHGVTLAALRELQERRKAERDSEPVAIIDLANLDYLLSGADADVWPPEREEMGDVLLYRHPQPAPVVPVVPDFKKLARELVDNLVDCGGLDEGVKEKYLEWAEKTCRAAMLAATQQEVK
ncbi:ead/Ea22-like family protein [Klebsiella pneumoniae]|uniref:ead/Ea22-like family protein n=1 Tax=Klebsiella pneumoniae TaxID=573 RepID=UPI000AF7AF00|nr:ead/Ea22-like family protein [Klebsiella pneumoniae]